ncbi:MAG TPA: LysR family transcriptional regulator, partial [Solirubrobacteraceae bacterium]|nr:LysR family transcriptional regulator [Solirubrobacteraceae bacterium]
MDLRELRYFVALAEERHFGRAAERLYIAQSGLSRAIQRSEDELGVALFARNRRHVELTQAGSALLERAYGVLSDFAEVQAVADATRRGLLGTVALANSPAARYELMPELLRAFADALPDVRVTRREQLGAAIAEGLVADELDVAIACGVPARAGLRRETLRDVELHLLLPAGHPLARRGRVAPVRLAGERVLLDAELAAAPPAQIARLYGARGLDVADHDEGLQHVRSGGHALLSARGFLGGPPDGVAALGLAPPARVALE